MKWLNPTGLSQQRQQRDCFHITACFSFLGPQAVISAWIWGPFPPQLTILGFLVAGGNPAPYSGPFNPSNESSNGRWRWFAGGIGCLLSESQYFKDAGTTIGRQPGCPRADHQSTLLLLTSQRRLPSQILLCCLYGHNPHSSSQHPNVYTSVLHSQLICNHTAKVLPILP